MKLSICCLKIIGKDHCQAEINLVKEAVRVLNEDKDDIVGSDLVANFDLVCEEDAYDPISVYDKQILEAYSD